MDLGETDVECSQINLVNDSVTVAQNMHFTWLAPIPIDKYNRKTENLDMPICGVDVWGRKKTDSEAGENSFPLLDCPNNFLAGNVAVGWRTFF
jgi:hypothetical protein